MEFIKANELRIGNFYDHNGFVNEANPNTIEEVWIAERSWVKPIPLTEEWLLKFGFEWKGNKFLTIFTPCGKALAYVEDNFFKFIGVTIEIQIKYVHQLQNLYFALTGEELTFKLE